MAELQTDINVKIKLGDEKTASGESNLPAIDKGSIVITKDTNRIYIDTTDDVPERIEIGENKQDKFANITNPGICKVTMSNPGQTYFCNYASDSGIYFDSSIRLLQGKGIKNDDDLVNKKYVDDETAKKQDKFATIEDTTNPYLILNFDSDGYVQTNLNINYPIIKDTSSQDKVKIDSKNFSIGETATGGVEFKAGSNNGDSFKITTGVMTNNAIPTIQFAPALNSSSDTGVVRLTGIAAPTADNDAVNKKYINDNILNYISLSYAAGPSGNQDTTSITADNSSTITLLNKDGIGIGISKGALAYIGPSNATLVGFNIDNSPIASEKYVSNSIATQVSSVYKAKGSITNLTALPTPDKAHEGYVYNIESAFTTTANFVEGAGKVYPAGTNVVCINTTGTTYKWDVLAGMVDLSNYATKTDLSGKQDKFADISYENNIATNDKLVLTPNVDNAISEVYFNIDGPSDWKMGTKAVSAPYFKTKNGYIIANTSSMPPILMSNVTTQATTPIINFESAANNNATILRGIADGLNDNDAVNVSQLVKKQDKITGDTDLVVKTLSLPNGIQIKYSDVASIEGIQFSQITGDNLVLRKVANGINNDEAVNVSQLNKKQDKFATVTTENTIQTIKIGDDLSIVTSPNFGYSQISSTKILTLSGADSASSYVSLRKTKLESNCDFDATQGYLRVRNDPLADDFAVNKKYVDDAIASSSITVDSELSDTSENPVQNKVIKAYINSITISDIDSIRNNATNGQTAYEMLNGVEALLSNI